MHRSSRGRSDVASDSLASRLYRGDVSYDFIGKRRLWYAGSGLLVLISLVSMFARGIHPSIDFKGGNVFEFPKHGHSIQDARSVFTSNGVTPEVVLTTRGVSQSQF